MEEEIIPKKSNSFDLEYLESTIENEYESDLSIQSSTTADIPLLWMKKLNKIKYLYVSVYCFICFWILWILTYFSFYGARVQGEIPQNLGCRHWGYASGPNCGLNGINCQPFTSEWKSFRCPAGCNTDTSLLVYGTGTYRANSRICRAAIHAGVMGFNGGCAQYRFDGEKMEFVSSTNNGVTSKEFKSWFPKSIQFRKANSSYCQDLSYPILGIGFFMLFFLSLFTISPLFLWQIILFCGYWYVCLIGGVTQSDYNYDAIFIHGTADVFIVGTLGYALYWISPVHTFSNWESMTRKKKMIFWGLYLFAYTSLLQLPLFAKIPGFDFDLGGYSTSNQTNMTIVVIVLVAIFLVGAVLWHFRILFQRKKLMVLLSCYMLVIISLGICWCFFPSYKFHLHHATLGALLLPIFRFPTTFSGFCQGISIGLLMQGYTQWGWDPVFVTKPIHLVVPVPTKPLIDTSRINSTTAEVSWERVAYNDLENIIVGYSLMLNGVEVFRQNATSFSLVNLRPNTTYYVTVSAIGSYGVDGVESDEGIFKTLE